MILSGIRSRHGNFPATRRGFTLLELMVVVAIVIVLASVGALSLGGTIRDRSLYRWGEQLQQDLRRSQEYCIMKRTDAVAGVTFTVGGTGWTVHEPTRSLVRVLPPGVTVAAMGGLPSLDDSVAFSAFGNPLVGVWSSASFTGATNDVLFKVSMQERARVPKVTIGIPLGRVALSWMAGS